MRQYSIKLVNNKGQRIGGASGSKRVKSGLRRRLESRADGRYLFGAVVLWLALGSAIVTLQSHLVSVTGGLLPADLQPLYSPQELYALFGAYGERGRAVFLAFTLVDILYPVAAYGFFALALARLLRPLTLDSRAAQALLLLPVAGLLVELVEQALFLVLLWAFPLRLTPMAWLASGVTLAKFLVLGLLSLSLTGASVWRFCLWCAAQHGAGADRP